MNALVHLFERLGSYVLTWSWQMAVLVLFAWIAVSFDRQHRPVLRHRLWVLTLLFGLLLPWVPERIAAQSFTRQVRQVLAEPVVPAPKLEMQDAGKTFSVPPAEAIRLQAAGVSSAVPIVSSGWSFSQTTFLRAIGLLWVTGVIVAAFRRLRGYRRLGYVASSATAGDEVTTPPILFSPAVRTPMLYGWCRPLILLPGDVANWSTPEERATMIRHESVHYARKDHWVSAFEALIRTVFFFHPLARWSCRQIDIERELACDEEVLRLGAEPETYAEAIIKVAEHSVAGGAPFAVYFSGTAQLDRRVDLLFRTPKRVGRSTVLLLPLVLLLAPTLALGFWQARIEVPAPIEFRFEVNPIGFLPVEILAPVPRTVQIAAITPPAVLSQDPPVKPVVSEPRAVRSADIAFVKVTEEQVMVIATLGFPDTLLTFQEDPTGLTTIRRASGRVEGQLTDLTGRVVLSIEDTFAIMRLAAFSADTLQVYQKPLYLKPGLYQLFLLVTDSNSGNIRTIDRRVEVPRFSADTLSASSLILADLVQPLSPGESSPAFRIGDFRVRPGMSEFRRDQELGIFQQIYVAQREIGSMSPLLMETLISLGGREIKKLSEEIQRSVNLTVTKRIPLADFGPGVYEVQTAYTDTASGERIVSTGQFSVK